MVGSLVMRLVDGAQGRFCGTGGWNCGKTWGLEPQRAYSGISPVLLCEQVGIDLLTDSFRLLRARARRGEVERALCPNRLAEYLRGAWNPIYGSLRQPAAEHSVPSRGANGGANGRISGERWLSLASPNSLKTQRPALACAGRAGLRIESSTTELRWRPPNLAACCSTRYSTASE